MKNIEQWIWSIDLLWLTLRLELDLAPLKSSMLQNEGATTFPQKPNVIRAEKCWSTDFSRKPLYTNKLDYLHEILTSMNVLCLM